MTAFADIADLVVPFDTLVVEGNTYKLQGLTAPHIVWVVRNHGAALAPLYQEAISGKLTADPETIAATLGDAFMPIVLAIVACGMGRPEAIDKVGLLPLPSLLEAIDKIIRLTLRGEDDLGKVVEIVTRALGQVKPLLARKT